MQPGDEPVYGGGGEGRVLDPPVQTRPNKEGNMAQIKWNGHGRRLALGYEWPAHGAVVTVDDPEVAAVLLAQPGNQFSVVDEAPPATPPEEGGEAVEEPKKIRKLSLRSGEED